MRQNFTLDFLKSNYTSLYFLGITILYWLDTVVFNPIVILSFVILIYQFITKNTKVGIYYAIVIFLVTFYLSFAFLSDFHKISIFDNNAMRFVFYGTLLLLSNYIISILMLLKFVKIENNKNEE